MLHLLAAPFLLISQLATLPGVAAPARDDAEARANTVGVLDLDQVSKEVGWATEIDEDRRAAQNEMNSEFTAYTESVMNAWVAKRREIGEAAHLNPDQLKVIKAATINGDDFKRLPLSKDQRDDFLRCASEAAETLKAARQQVREVLTKREGRVIDSYREAMKPSVRRVAAAAGIRIVPFLPTCRFFTTLRWISASR